MAFRSTLGRFTQMDPSGYADGLNLYGFSDVSPVGNLDPYGLQAKPATRPSHGFSDYGRPVPGVGGSVDSGVGHVGTVTVGTDAEYVDLGRVLKGGISFTYKGTECEECVFVQLVWQEILERWRGDELKAQSRVISSTAGDHRTTSDPSKPNWYVDGIPKHRGTTNPAYPGIWSRPPGQNQYSVFDAPGPFLSSSQFDDLRKNPLITEVRLIMHFDTFLVCDGKVVWGAAWDYWEEWTEDAAKRGLDPFLQVVPAWAHGLSRGIRVPQNQSSLKISDSQRKVINEQYPGQTMVR